MPEFEKAFEQNKNATIFYNQLKIKGKLEAFREIFIERGHLDMVESLLVQGKRKIVHNILESYSKDNFNSAFEFPISNPL